MSGTAAPGATDPIAHPARRTISDVTCLGCGCLCDDLQLDVSGGQIESFRPACPLAADWLLRPARAVPACRIEGRSAPVEQGVERAAQLLAAARYPLIYGFERATCEAQRVAVGIADRLGGAVDTSTSVFGGPTEADFKQIGEVTATWGEVSSRADFVLFWGADPV